MLDGRLPGPLGTAWLRASAFIVLGTAAVLLSIVSVGLPGTAVLAGGWLLAAGLARRVPGLDGPVSWAAAVVVEVSLLTLDTLVLKRLSPREHGSLPNLLVLSGPAIVGLLLVVPWPHRKQVEVEEEKAAEAEGAEEDEPEPAVRTPARALVALTVMASGLIVPLWVASHGVNYRIAWAMSGDSRNHALLARSLLQNGGLSLRVLKIYPALIDSITSLLDGAGHRKGLLPGQLILHDAKALVTTYVLAGIAMSTLIVAALLEMLPPAVAAARRLPAAVVVLVLGSTGVSVSALLLGTTIHDGFVSAYGTIPLALAGAVVALRCCARPSPASYALIGPAGVLAFLSFTPLAVVPLALVPTVSGVVIWTHRETLRSGDLVARARTGSGLAWLGAIALSWGSLVVCAGVTFSLQDTLHRQFLLPGSIISPNVRLLWLFFFLAVVATGLAARGAGRRQAAVVLASTIVCGAMIKFLLWLSPNGQTWSYYAAKTLYLLSGCLIWIAFVPALRAVSQPSQGRTESLVRSLQAAASVLVVFVVVGWSTTLTSPLTLAKTGWDQPSAAVITETARIADQGKPFILWEWSDPGNERLAEFWATLAWAYNDKWQPIAYPPQLTGGVPNWAYFEAGTPKDLCAVALSVNGVDIITHNAKLKAGLEHACPHSGAHVFVE